MYTYLLSLLPQPSSALEQSSERLYAAEYAPRQAGDGGLAI